MLILNGLHVEITLYKLILLNFDVLFFLYKYDHSQLLIIVLYRKIMENCKVCMFINDYHFMNILVIFT